ncbi:MAG: zinc-binding dehydrogenase [Streptosporangiales bacterium]|nr:zinc-binding dehydrogenase [Streptosporangiales bacterium]
MKALVATGDDDLVEFRDVDPPAAGPGEVLVDVRAVSLNRGELHRLRSAAAGWRPGWDFAGTVAADSAFPAGTPVCGLATGGSWAERVCVPDDRLTCVPPAVPLSRAAALPVAGLTALRTLRLAGELTGRRVHVTGSSGGVGGYAVDLARRAGARVVAAADEGCDVVLESVGGGSLAAALAAVAPGGLVVSFGNSAREQATFDPSAFYPRQAMLRGYYLLDDVIADPPAADLAHLVHLVANGELRNDVTHVADWLHARTALTDMRERRLHGKAVLEVTRCHSARSR